MDPKHPVGERRRATSTWDDLVLPKKTTRQLDAAERGDVVLFFDEADALCGKRTDIQDSHDSHDRYVNQEVDYLLERIEAFEGLVILASNRRETIDPAFIRRLRFVVTFPRRRRPITA